MQASYNIDQWGFSKKQSCKKNDSFFEKRIDLKQPSI